MLHNFRLQHCIEINRIKEKWTVVLGTMKTQAFLVLTQKEFGLLKRLGFYFNSESKILGLTRDFVLQLCTQQFDSQSQKLRRCCNTRTHQRHGSSTRLV